VIPLTALHVALFVTVHSRPGRIAVPLWTWGPPLLTLLGAVLLAGAFVSGLRGQGWTWRRTLAFVGIVALLPAARLYETFPSEHDSSPSVVPMRLPLDGPVTVAWGGPRERVNYHVRSPSERWAFDLLVTRDGRSHAGDGTSNTDYYAYNQPVRAPADGRVALVRDGVPDAAPGEPEPSRLSGNLVALEVASNQYMFLVHLKAGSIRVRPGDQVRRGDVLARVGNSGNSSEPHVHVHLQDGPVLDWGQGIPFYFSNYIDVTTGRSIDRGMPEGGRRRGRHVGDVVRAAD
jgi:murein DD-endopeptidase MepM/ murein hydrolase activator NlpD